MTELGNNSVKGTEFKLNINMTPCDGFHMEDVDFSVEVFTEIGFKKAVIEKADAVKVDADNYLVCVDSAVCGAGRYYARLTAHIPDADFPNGFRTERKTAFTGVTIDAV